MSEPRSVEAFVRSLREGDPETTRRLFDSYVDRLVAMAKIDTESSVKNGEEKPPNP